MDIALDYLFGFDVSGGVADDTNPIYEATLERSTVLTLPTPDRWADISYRGPIDGCLPEVVAGDMYPAWMNGRSPIPNEHEMALEWLLEYSFPLEVLSPNERPNPPGTMIQIGLVLPPGVAVLPAPGGHEYPEFFSARSEHFGDGHWMVGVLVKFPRNMSLAQFKAVRAIVAVGGVGGVGGGARPGFWTNFRRCREVTP